MASSFQQVYDDNGKAQQNGSYRLLQRVDRAEPVKKCENTMDLEDNEWNDPNPDIGIPMGGFIFQKNMPNGTSYCYRPDELKRQELKVPNNYTDEDGNVVEMPGHHYVPMDYKDPYTGVEIAPDEEEFIEKSTQGIIDRARSMPEISEEMFTMGAKMIIDKITKIDVISSEVNVTSPEPGGYYTLYIDTTMPTDKELKKINMTWPVYRDLMYNLRVNKGDFDRWDLNDPKIRIGYDDDSETFCIMAKVPAYDGRITLWDEIMRNRGKIKIGFKYFVPGLEWSAVFEILFKVIWNSKGQKINIYTKPNPN